MIQPLKTHESKNVLLEHASRFPATLIIGRDIEGPRRFYSSSIYGRTGFVELCLIVSQDDPQVQLLPSLNHALIGHDQFLSIIDINANRVVSSFPLEGVFYEFILDEIQKQFLAIHELGIVSISFEGARLWSQPTPEIVQGWKISDNTLELRLFDQQLPFLISLS